MTPNKKGKIDKANDEYLDVEQVAKFLKCSKVTVRRWIYSRKLESYRLPGTKKHLIRKKELEQLLCWNKSSF